MFDYDIYRRMVKKNNKKKVLKHIFTILDKIKMLLTSISSMRLVFPFGGLVNSLSCDENMSLFLLISFVHCLNKRAVVSHGCLGSNGNRRVEESILLNTFVKCCQTRGQQNGFGSYNCLYQTLQTQGGFGSGRPLWWALSFFHHIMCCWVNRILERCFSSCPFRK